MNDGSCLSNMQCVVGSDAEGYDQVKMYKHCAIFLPCIKEISVYNDNL